MDSPDREERRTTLHRMIGGNVKRLRTQRGMSQLQLAHSMGLKSVSLISKAEIGLERKHFNLEQLDRIAAVLEVDIREFFEGWERSLTEGERIGVR